jgi:caffeoyl-CoA O-methyltransferase
MNITPTDIEEYCVSHSSIPSETAKELQEYTKKNVHGSNMLIGEMEASVLRFLISLGGVKSVVEFGTYTGYSALAMAEALPADGKVFTIDINKETTAIARTFWDKSPHGKKIQQILRPGIDATKDLTGKYDLVFIDADKNNYSNYLDWALAHLSENGMIVVDNTLWSGKVLNSDGEKQTESIIAHNTKAKNLPGFVKVLLPIRDGMFLIKRDRT